MMLYACAARLMDWSVWFSVSEVVFFWGLMLAARRARYSHFISDDVILPSYRSLFS